MKKIISSIIFVIALSTLLFLSWWQVQRLEWKTTIIEQLNAEYAKDPAQNRFTFSNMTLTNDADVPLRYGSAQGRFHYNKEIFVGPKPLDGEIGYHVITPLALKKDGFILVNRGWVDQKYKGNMPVTTHPRGLITINGIFRQPDWNSFTPNNSPENDIWTKLDITQIAGAKNITPIAPLMLYAEESSKSFDVIQMGANKWQPRNKHKQYAFFWLSMAAALIAVFGLYNWNNRQEKNA